MLLILRPLPVRFIALRLSRLKRLDIIMSLDIIIRVMGKLEETIAVVTGGIGLAAARLFVVLFSLCKPLRRISIEPL